MSERAVVYEGTMETYKKKLEELSDLKRQVRILEEKNADYVQHNMELEEVRCWQSSRECLCVCLFISC